MPSKVCRWIVNIVLAICISACASPTIRPRPMGTGPVSPATHALIVFGQSVSDYAAPTAALQLRSLDGVSTCDSLGACIAAVSVDPGRRVVGFAFVNARLAGGGAPGTILIGTERRTYEVQVAALAGHVYVLREKSGANGLYATADDQGAVTDWAPYLVPASRR